MIGIILNTDPLVVKKKIDLQIVFSHSKILDTILGFTSFKVLAERQAEIKYTPFLFESITVAENIKLEASVTFLDAKIGFDGLVRMLPLNYKRMRFMSKKKYSPTNFIFEKALTKQFGDYSELSLKINDFLVLQPRTLREPFAVALTLSFQNNDFSILETYLNNNRCVTSFSKEAYYALIDRVEYIKPFVKLMLAKDKSLLKIKKNNPDIKEDLGRVRFLISNFGGRDLDKFLDEEKTLK